MRIALVVHGWPGVEAGGTGLYVEALAKALADAGHAVAVVCPRSRTGAGSDPRGVVRWPLADPPPRNFHDSWARPTMLDGWHRFQRAWRPDVVHIHHLSGLPLGLPEAAREGGARVVLSLHDYATVCARGQLVDDRLQPCRGPGPERCARCVSLHLRLSPLTARLGRALQFHPRFRSQVRQGISSTLRPGARSRTRIAHRLRAAGRALAAPHVLLSPSQDLADRLAAQGWPRAAVLPLPLVRTVPTAASAEPGPVRFLFASSVIPTKGPDRLLAAFQGLAPGTARLSIAGPCPPFDGHPSFADDLRLAIDATTDARWLGAVSPDEIPGLLAEHDVLVLPSTWPENSPLVIREATAAGLRVIASTKGGASELDPLLRGVDPSGGIASLTEALAAEAAIGRRRRSPLTWPTPSEHAISLLTGPYTTD